ncbi:uncharacterized protein PG998_011375 [Apiospora kogelbergensis]|uniref:Uncharacterized protein n=1 Tax=Apiospora kogelbergensis TaxID=1337665 RepID=A0AAW0RC69_9PEZI
MKTPMIPPWVLLASSMLIPGMAQGRHDTILGCSDVGCPPDMGRDGAPSVSDNCTVGPESHSYVGVARIPSLQAEGLKQGHLTWVQGSRVHSVTVDAKTNTHGQVYNHTFYLGAAPDLKLDDWGACAVFFNGPYNASLLNFTKTSLPEENEGTCADAMGGDNGCVEALQDRAMSLMRFGSNSSSSQGTCQTLLEDLQQREIPACNSWTEHKWGNLTAVALTGNNAPKPITGDRNASSNCWPVESKQDSLTPIFHREIHETNIYSYWAITPILTLFWPVTNGTTDNRRSNAALTCVKPIGPPNASLATMKGGGGDEGAASTVWSSSIPSIVAGTAAAFVLFNLL